MSTFCIPFISSSLPVRFRFMIFICFCSLERGLEEGGETGERRGEEMKKKRGRREDDWTRKYEYCYPHFWGLAKSVLRVHPL